MKRLFVFADFDWLENIELVGELTMDSIRGGETYGFKFEPSWLKKHGSVSLSDDLNNYVGMQYGQPDKDIFGCFSDSLPDRWGRTLVLRREQILAAEGKRPVRRLSSMDYLLGIDDATRMGGFRFKQSLEGEFINCAHELQIPLITSIRELIAASHEVELSEEKNALPEKRWIMQLVQPGTSLGGARPKASVVDENKHLYVAKFPSRKDLYDVGLWEHFAHLMEEGCFDGCYLFPSSYTQRAFLAGRDVWKNQELYDDCWGEVVLMSGLPGTGKDTWIKHNIPDLPMISLDDIRRINKIPPTAKQGKVANIAREQAKEYLRQHQPFVWNATNITAQMRESLISLFETYHAQVRVVYLETDWQTLLERNRSRKDAVPQLVIEEMMDKMTLPEASEARKVVWRSV